MHHHVSVERRGQVGRAPGRESQDELEDVAIKLDGLTPNSTVMAECMTGVEQDVQPPTEGACLCLDAGRAAS